MVPKLYHSFVKMNMLDCRFSCQSIYFDFMHHTAQQQITAINFDSLGSTAVAFPHLVTESRIQF